jgi:hypothetical protein
MYIRNNTSQTGQPLLAIAIQSRVVIANVYKHTAAM